MPQADNRRTTKSRENLLSAKWVVVRLTPFQADKNTNLTTLLSALSALSAKPANPWYVGLFRADNKFAHPHTCCPLLSA